MSFYDHSHHLGIALSIWVYEFRKAPEIFVSYPKKNTIAAVNTTTTATITFTLKQLIITNICCPPTN